MITLSLSDSSDYTVEGDLLTTISSDSVVGAEACVTFSLLDDNTIEPSSEKFSVLLSSKNAGLGEVKEAEIEILNINSKSIYT